jgi:S-adenosylmethionine decarboxylase
MHLIIDGYDCDSDLLSDRVALLRWLDGLPAQIGMSVLMPAAVKKIGPPRCRPDDAGLSGVVVICESHIAVHTWPRRRELQADVYSCKPFDAGKVLERFIHDFGIGSCDTKLVERRKRIC